jgi:hypothetical protein
MSSSSQRAPERRSGSIPIASIVALVGKGMTPREILEIFPELQPEDIRSALLNAADVVRDADASLRAGDPVGDIIRQAQQSSGLAKDEAVELAVRETRTTRRERNRHK